MTGPDCAEFITEPLQAMRELNPTLNAMLQSSEQMNKVACEAAKKPLKKRRKIASSVVAVHDAHLQRLEGLKAAEAENASDPLLRTLAQLPPIPQPAAAGVAPEGVPPPPPQAQEEEDESSLSSRAHMETITGMVPRQFHIKLAILGNYLKAHPTLIRVGSSGRPIVGGVEIPRTHIMDIMRALYVHRKGEALPRDPDVVIQALQSVGVPSSLLSSSTARNMYRHVLEASEEAAHAETEGEGEESEQQEEEEGETTQKFATPAHSSVPPAPPVPQPPPPLQPPHPKVVERSSSISAAPAAAATTKAHAPTKESPTVQPTVSKQSGIPTAKAKHEAASKGATSQKGQGYWPGC